MSANWMLMQRQQLLIRPTSHEMRHLGIERTWMLGSLAVSGELLKPSESAIYTAR